MNFSVTHPRRRQPGIRLPRNEKMLIAITHKTLIAIRERTRPCLWFLSCLPICLLLLCFCDVHRHNEHSDYKLINGNIPYSSVTIRKSVEVELS